MLKPTIYTAFANSVDPDQFLPNLTEEAFRIADLMQGLAFNDKLYYIKDELFDPDRLINNFSRFGKRFTLFYFSGHGKKGCIRMAGNETVDATQMARVINSNLTELEFGFFNACETLDLVRAIVKGRRRGTKNLALISSPREVNSFVAERFATLLFTQIGQPGTYFDAYQQAKDLVQVLDKRISFHEVASLQELEGDLGSHDFCYVEIRNGKVQPPGSKKQKRKQASIIDTDRMLTDALRVNYVNEVVQTISKSNMTGAALAPLQQALDASRQVMDGVKKPKDVAAIWQDAVAATPGLQSAATFQALINMEKSKDQPFMHSFRPLKDATIDHLKQTLSADRA